jgi:hypothetical protein
VVFSRPIPQIPQQFYAETEVTTSTNGVIDTQQHDFIWYDGVASKMKTISVDEIFGTNDTVVYRGDQKREYYVTDDKKCFYMFAPPTIDIKLKIKENSTLEGVVEVSGIMCEFWMYKVLNEEINYYIKANDTIPVKMEVVEGKTLNEIVFKVFRPQISDPSVYEINGKLNCEEAKISNVDVVTREHLKKHLNAFPIHETSANNLPARHKINPEKYPESSGSIDPATIILIGQTIWAIVKENKPESSINTNQNAVVPKGATWTDLAGWRQQKWPGWQWTLVNGFGGTVVDYKWSFNFLCQGKYKNIGKYLENAGAFPTSLDVAWGYTVNVKAQILNPFNYGTTSNPVAGLTLTMTLDSSTVIKKITQTCTVNLLGDCATQLVSCNGYKDAIRFHYY